ncbi:MAG: BTAD domain-containing putative transcriptional regulator, partial [Acidimicrobiia bacterium]
RHAADLDAAEFLDLALRAFASGTTSARNGPPPILAVRSSSARVELLLASPPQNPPKGFVITDNDRGWVTDPDLDVDDLRALAAGAAAPLPSLVCVGELDGEQILIDLETAGLLTVNGSEAEPFLNSVALQLATATWIDYVDVLLVASATNADIAGASRVRRLPDLRTAIDELHAIGRSFGEALASSDSTSTLHARFSGHHNDGWIPTILITTEPIDRDLLDEVQAIVARGGRGVAVVATSPQRTTWHADVERECLRLDPLGFDLSPSLLDAEAAHQIDELLTDAVVGEHFDAIIETATEEPAAEHLGPYVDSPFEVEVRVLGPVEIDGIPGTIERRRAAELIAYLALHPKGATEDRLKTVLWRDNAPTAGTFNTTVTFARTSLGFDSDGSLHFPHYSAAGHTYRLGPHVTTDLARFEARVVHAKICGPAEAINALQSALALVRGAPFAQTRGFEWAYSEQIIASAEVTIADAAHRLAALCHQVGDHAGATSAAIQGLRACPGDETLYRDRMRACHLAGNLAGVEAAFDELCEVVEALEPYDALHPETVELYDQLRRSK